ncbi:MAG: MFS transporter [Ferruginibacter sp.]
MSIKRGNRGGPITGLISAEFLSLLGNQVAAVAIPILVLAHTHSTMVTGIAVVGNTIPFVIAAFFGGKAIDRFGAWPVSVAADLLSCISVLALPLAFMLYPGNIPSAIIFLLVFAGALFDPTGVTARHTLVPGLTRFAGRRLERVNTLRGGLENAADFIGPVIGVGLIGLIGINNTFFANAVSFLLCALIFACSVPGKRNKSREKHPNNILAGAGFIFRDTNLRTLAIAGMIAGLIIAPFLGLLLLVLATRRFDNPALFGISMSVFGITATLGALSFSKLRALYSYSFIYYGGLLIMGLGIALCGIVTTQYGVVASAALTGLAGSGNPLEQTILQEQTPKIFAGQVFAALPAIRFTAGTLGLILAGFLAERYSVNWLLLMGGSLLIITAVSGWFIAPLQDKSRHLQSKN